MRRRKSKHCFVPQHGQGLRNVHYDTVTIMGKFSMMCIGAAGRYQRFVAANEDEKSEFKKSNNGDIAYNCSECGHAGLIKVSKKCHRA